MVGRTKSAIPILINNKVCQIKNASKNNNVIRIKTISKNLWEKKKNSKKKFKKNLENRKMYM